MKRINKLTKKQEAAMKPHADKWIEIGLRTGDADFETFDKYMPVCYEKAGLEYPKNVVRVQSPLVGALAASLANQILDSRGVRGAVSGAVIGAVGGAVRDADLKWHHWLGGQFWVGGWSWGVAYSNFFFDVCGLKLDKDIMERAEAYKKVCESVNYIWPNSNFVIVCDRPKHIKRNAEGQLHSTNGKAIEYKDGWGLYMLNGVRFDEELYKRVTDPNTPVQEILAIEDVDQRTQALNPEFRKVEDVVTALKGEKLDSYDKITIEGEPIHYELYRFPSGEVFTEDAYYALFDCPSTGKKHLEGVEVSKTVPEAMAWREEITVDEWKLRVPLVDEV